MYISLGMPVVGAQPENVPFSLKCIGIQGFLIGNIYVPMGKEL